MHAPVITRNATDDDIAGISQLYARVFGPGRFARTAYRVREGTPLVSRYCHVVTLNGRVLAALRMTEITIGGAGPAGLLGPIAVDQDFASQGYGKRLIAEAFKDAKAEGAALIVLVGDKPYYSRFGFETVPPGHFIFPGPVDPARILAAELKDGALARFEGLVKAKL